MCEGYCEECMKHVEIAQTSTLRSVTPAVHISFYFHYHHHSIHYYMYYS